MCHRRVFPLLLLRRGCASCARPGVQRGWRFEQLQQEGADGVVFFLFFLGHARPAPWAWLRTSVNADLCTRSSRNINQFASLPCWLITRSPCAARAGSTDTVPADQGRPQAKQHLLVRVLHWPETACHLGASSWLSVSFRFTSNLSTDLWPQRGELVRRAFIWRAMQVQPTTTRFPKYPSTHG